MALVNCWINGYLQVNGVDLSDHVREMALDTSVLELADNTHGDNTAKVTAGIEDWTIGVTFLQDFSLSSVDATLRPLCTVGLRPFFLVIGASADLPDEYSPWYKAAGIITGYKPLSGTHGTSLQAVATFRVASGLQRITDISQDSRLRPNNSTLRVRPERHSATRIPLDYNGWA